MTTPFPAATAAILSSILLGSATLLLPSDARAQDMPYVDAVGAYHHANVMTRPGADANAGKKPKPVDAKPAEGQTISQAQMDRIVAGLRADYHERVARDGKASADAWLRRTVDELKRKYTTVE